MVVSHQLKQRRLCIINRGEIIRCSKAKLKIHILDNTYLPLPVLLKHIWLKENKAIHGTEMIVKSKKKTSLSKKGIIKSKP